MMLDRYRRTALLLPVVVTLVGVALLNDRATPSLDAHTQDRHIEFGRIGTGLDPDTIRKVTPRKLTITAGQTVTFHVNDGGHQVLVLRPGVDIDDLGSEGLDVNGIAPDSSLPPDIYPAVAAPTGLTPIQGPGRWDANGDCTMGGAGDVLRPQVFFKQRCGPASPTVVDVQVTFDQPGRYVFICNLVVHYLDENTTITGPAGSVVFNGFGMHGQIIVRPN